MSLSLWHDVLPWLRPGAEQDMPESVRLALEHAHWGQVVRMPRRGQIPHPVLRARVRSAHEAEVAAGLTRSEAVRIVAERSGIHPRTVERMLGRRRVTPNV